jgi:hypothetical protein
MLSQSPAAVVAALPAFPGLSKSDAFACTVSVYELDSGRF